MTEHHKPVTVGRYLLHRKIAHGGMATIHIARLMGDVGFSRIVGWVDRYIVDGVLNVVSAWTLTSGDDLRTMQSGRAQDYVYAVALGVLALLVWLQWMVA